MNIAFLSLGDTRLYQNLEDVDVALQSIMQRQTPNASVSAESEKAPAHIDSDNAMLDTLESHAIDATFFPPATNKFVCSLQYDSEVEFERILTWAQSSADNILKVSKRNVEAAHDLEVTQMQKLFELSSWRKELFLGGSRSRL